MGRSGDFGRHRDGRRRGLGRGERLGGRGRHRSRGRGRIARIIGSPGDGRARLDGVGRGRFHRNRGGGLGRHRHRRGDGRGQLDARGDDRRQLDRRRRRRWGRGRGLEDQGGGGSVEAGPGPGAGRLGGISTCPGAWAGRARGSAGGRSRRRGRGGFRCHRRAAGIRVGSPAPRRGSAGRSVARGAEHRAAPRAPGPGAVAGCGPVKASGAGVEGGSAGMAALEIGGGAGISALASWSESVGADVPEAGLARAKAPGWTLGRPLAWATTLLPLTASRSPCCAWAIPLLERLQLGFAQLALAGLDGPEEAEGPGVFAIRQVIHAVAEQVPGRPARHRRVDGRRPWPMARSPTRAPGDNCCARAIDAERPIAASDELKANVERRKPRLLAWLNPRPAESGGPEGMRFRPYLTD